MPHGQHAARTYVSATVSSSPVRASQPAPLYATQPCVVVAFFSPHGPSTCPDPRVLLSLTQVSAPAPVQAPLFAISVAQS